MQNNICLSAPYVRLRPWLGFPVAALGNISGVGDAAVGKRHKNLVKKTTSDSTDVLERRQTETRRCFHHNTPLC